MSTVTPPGAIQLIEPAKVAKDKSLYCLVDVRSPLEFETEHVDGSTNLPLKELESRFEELSRNADLVIVCRSGKRAQRAAFTLEGHGFQPKVMSGGLEAWKKSGLPVKFGKKMISIERQIQLVVGISVLTGLILGELVSRWFLLIPAFFGAGLTFAGLSGTCALGMLLDKAPWNRLSCVQENANRNCCG